MWNNFTFYWTWVWLLSALVTNSRKKGEISREKKSEIWIAFTFFFEKWKIRFLHSFSRSESEIEMARDREREVKVKKISRHENLTGEWTKLFRKETILFVCLALLVSFILCQYFEPFTCCDDFSHLLAWEKLSFVLYFSLVLESSSLSSDDFRQFLAWRAGPRLHVGSGALMAFLTSSHRLYPQPFSDRASDGRPTKRRWINLPIEVEICYKVRKKTNFAAHLSNPREIAYTVMVKFKETHDWAGRPFR